jgi:hypothetical protein
METFDKFQELMICTKKFKYPELLKIILKYYKKTNKLTILKYKNNNYVEPILDNYYYLKIYNSFLKDKNRNNLIIDYIDKILNQQLYNKTKKYLILCKNNLQLELIKNLLKIDYNQIVFKDEHINYDPQFILINYNKNYDNQQLLNYNFDILIFITPLIHSFNKILNLFKTLNNKTIYYVYDDYGLTKNNDQKIILPETFTLKLFDLN